jgi:hypothetical protein
MNQRLKVELAIGQDNIDRPTHGFRINGWLAAATFEGEFSNVTGNYAGKGVVRYAW